MPRLPLNLALLAALLLASACRRAPEAQPDLKGLEAMLRKSAEERLPTPEMTDGSLSLPVAPDRRAAEAERIAHLAGELGGGSLHTDLPSGEVHLMVQVPAAAEREFRAELLHKPVDRITVAPTEDSQVWIDITLRDPA